MLEIFTQEVIASEDEEGRVDREDKEEGMEVIREGEEDEEQQKFLDKGFCNKSCAEFTVPIELHDGNEKFVLKNMEALKCSE